jgi:hypothetical protein
MVNSTYLPPQTVMGPFCNREAGRGHHNIPNRRVADGDELSAMVAFPRLDWPVDLFLRNENVSLMPLEKLKSELLCTCGVSSVTIAR